MSMDHLTSRAHENFQAAAMKAGLYLESKGDTK